MKPMEALLHWVTERERIRIKKEAGEPLPWTEDSILATYRFCNVRREDDRVTVWVRENIRQRFVGSPHLWFMLCCARQINWPETLGHLIDDYSNAWPDKSGFTPRAMAIALNDMARRGQKVFTGAYNITAPPTKGDKKTDYVANVTLGALWGERVVMNKLWDRGNQPSMKYVHSQLLKFNCWGPFLAYQAVVDMRFTALLSNARDVADWCAAGPGTLRGLNRIAGRELRTAIDQDKARVQIVRLWETIKKETGVGLDLSDVPNVLCETDKYLRVLNNEGKPRATYVPGRGS